jgi:hypothetical protein
LSERHGRAAIKRRLAAGHERAGVKTGIDTFFSPAANAISDCKRGSFAAYREGIFAERRTLGLRDHERGYMDPSVFK